jgi:HPr serine kinase-like protein
MALYTFQEVTLELTYEEQHSRAALDQLLHDLSWVRTDALRRAPSLRLAVHRYHGSLRIPPSAHEVLRADGFYGLEDGADFYLTDRASLWQLQPMQGQGAVYLAPSFAAKPALLQRTVWAFGLLKLLRPLGLYSLHAAGVVSPHGAGLLLVGASGCGKSTLALGLVRQGWGYLSDDAVLLRRQAAAVEAYALRKPFYVNANVAARYADLPLGEEVPDTTGERRRRVHIAQAFPGQAVSTSRPQVVLFPRIVPQPHSTLQPLERLSAFRDLLAQSGPQLFDRRTMGQHLDVLKGLVQQTATYTLWAGRDLYQQPGRLLHLLREIEGEVQWPAWSWS